ncbi:thioredoxin family protein [Thiocystis violacea]|uniref:thioredoxin family protein n=1 Tax=Thiocystis violacea TaxID=13725 RepID=UPI0019076549|nr:thioredoxin domain-containing protein [Thiocystis violacea]MBK1722269.1 hypothetical protein [Thiocystis violacea]
MAHSTRLTVSSLLLSLTLFPFPPCSAAQGQSASIEPPIAAPRGLLAARVRPGIQSGAVTTVTEADFNPLALQSERPVLVFCVADWSSPARDMEPVITAVAGAYAQRLRVLSLDVEKNPTLRNRYVISGIPAYLLFERGEIVATKLGTLSREQLEHWLDTALH